MNRYAYQETQYALSEAMNKGIPFSLLRNRDVQMGVYIHYTQAYFQKYYLV